LLVQRDRAFRFAQTGAGADQVVMRLVVVGVELDRTLVQRHSLAQFVAAVRLEQIAVSGQQPGLLTLGDRLLEQRLGRLEVALIPARSYRARRSLTSITLNSFR
jgi:hypothetical protein